MTKHEHNRRPGRSSSWCHKPTRLAIYLRDGLSCVYCGATVEDGARLSLDHVKPQVKDGSNEPENLITACTRCNSARQDRPLVEFVRTVADYLGKDADQIVKHIRNCRARRLPRSEARSMIARRGSLSACLINCEG